jgi:hypothetical protein
VARRHFRGPRVALGRLRGPRDDRRIGVRSTIAFHPLGATMSTRTIAIIALVIAVALVVILFVL